MKKSPWPHWDTHTHTRSLWKFEILTLVYEQSVFIPREDFPLSCQWEPPPSSATYCLTPPQVRPKERGKFSPDRSGHAWRWVLLAVSVAFSRTAHWNFPCGSPRTRQYLSCWLLPSASSFWFPFHLSLGSSHPQAEAVLGKTCFKETQAGIPGAQRSHSFNLPLPRWGKGKSSHFPQHSRLLCHFRPLWLPSHICFLRQVSHGNPQILGDTYQALQLLPLKPIYQGLRWKAYPFRPHPPWGR